jgi:hypothetical protein
MIVDVSAGPWVISKCGNDPKGLFGDEITRRCEVGHQCDACTASRVLPNNTNTSGDKLRSIQAAEHV